MEQQAWVRELLDKGKLIEAGFVGLRFAAIPRDAPAIQIEEMRHAFFAGALHVFGSIMSVSEPGTEATENDLRRLSSIHAELEEFLEQFNAKQAITNQHERMN